MGCNQGKESNAKVVTVFGATGNQGGSVVEALLADKKNYKVRAVTRNPESEKAKGLKEKGAEVVKADLDDVESLKAAIEGAYGVFAVTNYWELFDMEKEIQQGKNLVDVAKECEVEHFVFSSLDNVRDSLGKSCPHFDTKATVQEYIKEKELPATCFILPAYYENLLTTLVPQKNEDDQYILNIPVSVPMHMIPVKEIGECIHKIFDNLDEYKGKTIPLSADKKTVEEYAEILEKVLGKKFVATKMDTIEFAKLGFPGADDLAVMFEFYQTDPHRDMETTRKLNPKISTFEQWVEKNKEAFEKALGGDAKEEEKEEEDNKEEDAAAKETKDEKEEETKAEEKKEEEKSEETKAEDEKTEGNTEGASAD